MPSPLPFVVSAPAKVILFGEHSAVYKKPAIAASVNSLRTYLYVCRACDDGGGPWIELDFPDIKFNHRWSCASLVEICKEVGPVGRDSIQNVEETAVAKRIHSLIDGSDIEDQMHKNASFCFLYLYVNILLLDGASAAEEETTQSIKFVLKSTSPIGAGLGSSASISVTLSQAMLYLRESRAGGGRLTSETINGWAYVGEKCLHGDPSGIDNAVATYGGAIYYMKGQPFQFVNLDKSNDALKVIVTYTGIPRSTKTLVSNVRRLYEEEPRMVSPIIESMGVVAEESFKHLQKCSRRGDGVSVAKLLQLIDINHGLLVALGVSHPGIEKVKLLGDTLQVGSTKLTGAGGGGCVFTLVDPTCSEGRIQEFRDAVEREHGHQTFATDLGGLGCVLLEGSRLQRGQLHAVEALFHRKSTSAAEINALLLPGEPHSPLPWSVHS